MTDKGFKAEIIADSINPEGSRVTTFLLTYPRFIHSEFLTARMFSRNSASSRAIPIEKMIEQVRTNPAMPVRWGLNGKGMQDHGAFESEGSISACKTAWKLAAESAIGQATYLRNHGLHKQIVNRVLEPFMWMTTLVTATEWENFYSLRLHKDAQPEFQHLAHIMLRTYLASQPTPKAWGEWHIPFGDKVSDPNVSLETRLKIATARAARTSYLTMDKDHSVEKDIEMHDRLAAAGHWSPFEHACWASSARSDSNFRGWQQYRKQFGGENRRCDLKKLLEEYEASNA